MRLQRQPGCSHPRAVFEDDAEVEEVRDRLAKGADYKEIAREKGCHPTTIWRLMHKISYPRK